MFRELMRVKQKLTADECAYILKNEPRGVLSVIGDDGYPYGMPIDFFYDEESGNIRFHTGKKGHRTDSLKNCNKVSFCIYDEGFRREGEWALNIKSVIVFGRIRFIEDRDAVAEITRKLSRKYTSDEEYIEKEIDSAAHRTLCLELIPEYICGKIVNES